MRIHLQGGRQPAQLSFLFTERLLTLVCQILFFPHPSPGRSPPPHAHGRAMARQQTRAPFFKVVRLHLINSQPRPDWLREKELGPRSAPQIQSELCAVCPREANHGGLRRSEIPKDKIPESSNTGTCPVTGSKLSMAGQRKADSWKAKTMKRQCERVEPEDLKDI